jgi:hypothetical protein
MVRKLLIASGIPCATLLISLGCASGWTLAQPPHDPPGDASLRHSDLHARYAAARLRLAETRLQRAERLNDISPRQLTEADMRSLRTRVELLRAEAAETREQPHGYGFAAQRTAAHGAVRLAEQELAATAAVNARRTDAMAPFDLRLREVRLEIARLRAEIWDDPAFLVSPTDVLQMQIDQLADQLHDVLHDVGNAPAIERR